LLPKVAGQSREAGLTGGQPVAGRGRHALPAITGSG